MASILSRPQWVNLLSSVDAYLQYCTKSWLIHYGPLPIQFQAIIWANADSLQISRLGTNVAEERPTTDWCEKW